MIKTNNDFRQIKSNEIPKIIVKGHLKDLTQLNNKVLYWIAVNEKLREPTAKEKWIESYPFLEAASWDKIYRVVHFFVKEPYFQSFQYKVLNRIINCKQNLHKWKIKDCPNCTNCREEDTIEHHLFQCIDSNKFWTDFRKWIIQTFQIRVDKYTVCEIIFGYGLKEPKMCQIDLVHNMLILLGKWFINQSKTNEKNLNL